MGYGFGVMFPVLMFGSVSGAHINPAATIAQTVRRPVPVGDVVCRTSSPSCSSPAQPAHRHHRHYPHYKETEDAEAILGTFCTTDAGQQRSAASSTGCSGTRCSSSAPCAAMRQGQAGLRRRLLVIGFVHCGASAPPGWPDRPLAEPDPRPHAASAPRHPADPAQRGSSRWARHGSPVVAPIVGAIIGAWLFVFFFAS